MTGSPTTRDPDPYRHLEPTLVRLATMHPTDPARRAVRNQLAVAFAPVCRNVASRFARTDEPREDLEQVAAMGILKALDRFQPPAGSDPIIAFMGYAVPTIAGEIQRHLRDHTWVVRVPRPVKEIQSRLWCAVSELAVDGRPPRPSELAAHLGVDRKLVVEAMQVGSAKRPTSTDGRVGVDGAPVVDGSGRLDDALAAVECRTELREATRLLPTRSMQIIAMRYFDDLTQAQIGAELGISQMHVSRLLRRSLTALRTRITSP